MDLVVCCLALKLFPLRKAAHLESECSLMDDLGRMNRYFLGLLKLWVGGRITKEGFV